MFRLVRVNFIRILIDQSVALLSRPILIADLREIAQIVGYSSCVHERCSFQLAHALREIYANGRLLLVRARAMFLPVCIRVARDCANCRLLLVRARAMFLQA